MHVRGCFYEYRVDLVRFVVVVIVFFSLVFRLIPPTPTPTPTALTP